MSTENRSSTLRMIAFSSSAVNVERNAALASGSSRRRTVSARETFTSACFRVASAASGSITTFRGSISSAMICSASSSNCAAEHKLNCNIYNNFALKPSRCSFNMMPRLARYHDIVWCAFPLGWRCLSTACTPPTAPHNNADDSGSHAIRKRSQFLDLDLPHLRAVCGNDEIV